MPSVGARWKEEGIWAWVLKRPDHQGNDYRYDTEDGDDTDCGDNQTLLPIPFGLRPCHSLTAASFDLPHLRQLSIGYGFLLSFEPCCLVPNLV
jgi:hypothetical protein